MFSLLVSRLFFEFPGKRLFRPIIENQGPSSPSFGHLWNTLFQVVRRKSQVASRKSLKYREPGFLWHASLPVLTSRTVQCSRLETIRAHCSDRWRLLRGKVACDQ